jgi:hypothetical protein
MKTPRVEDFDPNAAPTLGSPHDNYPAIEKAKSSVPLPQPVSEFSVPEADPPPARTPDYYPLCI